MKRLLWIPPIVSLLCDGYILSGEHTQAISGQEFSPREKLVLSGLA
jgi:hypothetical protein